MPGWCDVVQAAEEAAALRAATTNPYLHAALKSRATHQPPPGLRLPPEGGGADDEAEKKNEARAAAAAATESAGAGTSSSEAKDDDDDLPPSDVGRPAEGPAAPDAYLPASFAGRGARPRAHVALPVERVDDSREPRREDRPSPKQKRTSIYASQGGGLANPSRKKRRRMGAPDGPAF
mmetsp:Transcript_21407/g.85145  ORF Transcript_21407/g.85145 Transcript_21407/m.85145 type:complete len:178 (+) Transcript_21407:170-703(+)